MTGYVRTNEKDLNIPKFHSANMGRLWCERTKVSNGNGDGLKVNSRSENVYELSFFRVPLEGGSVALKGYLGERIPVKGQFMAQVKYENSKRGDIKEHQRGVLTQLGFLKTDLWDCKEETVSAEVETWPSGLTKDSLMWVYLPNTARERHKSSG